MTQTKRQAHQKEIAALENRIAELEAILKCVHCEHLRSEHDTDEENGACYGGRAGLNTGEGEYCMCRGFESESTRLAAGGGANG